MKERGEEKEGEGRRRQRRGKEIRKRRERFEKMNLKGYWERKGKKRNIEREEFKRIF